MTHAVSGLTSLSKFNSARNLWTADSTFSKAILCLSSRGSLLATQ